VNTCPADRSAEPLWTIPQAAEYLGLSVSWVRQRVAAGKIPCIRVGGWAVRFEPDVLRAWARGDSLPGPSVVPMRRRVP
jgi:excisionase family DNA binding protein